MPSIKFNTVEFARLYEIEPNQNVDVLAVVKDAGELVELTSKAQKQVIWIN
jgi:adenylosuccinate lyase